MRELLALAPAPRVLLFKGSLGADMESFGAFLQAMGYPAPRLRNPATGRYSYSLRWNGCSCAECEALADSIGALVRSEGMAPMLVGHSGGGVTRRPHPAAAGRRPRRTAPALRRHAGHRRAVALGAGLSGLRRRRAAAGPGAGLGARPSPATASPATRSPRCSASATTARPQAAIPPAQVRNVLLPAQVSHVRAFEVDGYAEHPQVRAWIEAYQPGSDAPLPDAPGLDLSNLPHAADLWHSLKKHWALQARQWAAQPSQAD